MKLSKCYLTEIGHVVSRRSVSSSTLCHGKAWGLNIVNGSVTVTLPMLLYYLDTLELQDRPAARVGRPTAPTASESKVIPSDTAVAKMPAKNRTSQAQC